MKHIGLMLCLSVALGTSAQQQKKMKTATPKKAAVSTAMIAPDPSVKMGRLANGLVYYIKRNVEPRHRAELYLANRIGSLMEDDDQRGLAHFTEHMAFNGTGDFPKNELISYLQRAGVRFGADLNAYTGFNETVYQLPIPTDSAAVFAGGFRILANWAGKVLMEGTEIDAERGVIVEEDRQRGKNAQQRMNEKLFGTIFGGSRYAHRLPIGKLDILHGFKHERIRSFYHDWYRPNLQAVIAVGDFDVAQVERMIIENFSGFVNPKVQRERKYDALPERSAPVAKVVTDPEQPYNNVQVIFRRKGAVLNTVADYRRAIGIELANMMLAERFQELLQSGKAPFLYGAGSYGEFEGGMVWGQEAFSMQAVASDGKGLSAALTAVVAEGERMARFGFLASELSAAKREMSAGNEKMYAERDKTASSRLVQGYLDHFLKGTAMPSIAESYQLTKRALAEITLLELNTLVKSFMGRENLMVLVRAPEKEKNDLPSREMLLAAVDAGKNNLAPYVDNRLDQPLIAQLPVAGKLVKEEKNEKLGLAIWTLSNGAKVVLKPTDFRNDQILVGSFGAGGTSLAADAELRSAEMAGVIAKSGTGGFSPSQLSKYLAGSTASVWPYVSSLYQGYSGSVAPKDMETALQLIYAHATAPRKDAELFAKQLREMKVVLGSKGASPMGVLNDTLSAVLANYHQRSMPMELKDVEGISLDKSFDFYRMRMANANGQVFVLVGNFDAEAIRPLVLKYLAGLPALEKPEQFVDRGIEPPKGKVYRTVSKGIEDKASVRLYFHGDFDYTAENNMQLSALKAALELKVTERLREKESGVYSPSVGLSVAKLPKAHYYFTIGFDCAKGNVDKLIAAALDEVEKFRKEGATSGDLAKFRSEEQRQHELSLRNNQYWLNYLMTRLKYGDDMELVLSQLDRANAVSVESSRAAAQRYLSGEHYIQVVLVPEK